MGIDAPTGDVYYTYDTAGRRKHLVYPGSTWLTTGTGEVLTYTHDAAGRLRTVTDWDGGVTVYTYTAAGRLSGMALPNGVTTRYTYDAAGRLVEIVHRDAQGALLARYVLTVTVADTGGNPEAGLKVYAFDEATYTGYNKTTDVSGLATFTLPIGDYRFRADKNSTQFWSGTANHCAVPGCASAAITTTVPLTVTVQDTSGNPEAGLNLFSAL